MIDPEHTWFRKRGYLHFDKPVNLEHALSIVSDTKSVSQHSFLPFISFKSSSYKIYLDKSTNKIEKKTKDRDIAYSSHIDSHIYSYYASILDKFYENNVSNHGLNENILAFRTLGKSNINFAYDAFEDIKNIGDCVVVALDITKFFDHINHSFLKKYWSELIGEDLLPSDHYSVFKSITRYAYVDRNDLYDLFSLPKNNAKHLKKLRKQICSFKDFRDLVRGSNLIQSNKLGYGIPQGSPISALLSNIYMLDFDIKAKLLANGFSGKYYRYCDDMLFILPYTGNYGKNHGKNIERDVNVMLSQIGVSLNLDKTEIRTFKKHNDIMSCDHPVQYLGFLFDGKNIILRSSSISRYSNKMKRGVRLARATMKRKNKIRKAKGLEEKEIFREKIYARYTHVGRRNFLSYGYRASRIMNSKSIRNQLKPLWNRVQKEIDKN